MNTIYKYEINSLDRKQTIMMPKDSTILKVSEQLGIIVMWAEVNTDSDNEERCIEIFSTGEKIHYDMGVERNHLGTILLLEDRLVLHVFERLN